MSGAGAGSEPGVTNARGELALSPAAKQLIDALRKTEGNQKQAANLLGVSASRSGVACKNSGISDDGTVAEPPV